ncbi:hypothetical protein [Cryobacterium sp. MLB-32]|uniref:hypothetical protein n=1 Tax=Cryobacterium sp. MLB-32 TaxID=1529318 RepID=UPI0012E02EED|nr:hypothetical protein [Cryobacterium sp. MLB-32]
MAIGLKGTNAPPVDAPGGDSSVTGRTLNGTPMENWESEVSYVGPWEVLPLRLPAMCILRMPAQAA